MVEECGGVCVASPDLFSFLPDKTCFMIFEANDCGQDHDYEGNYLNLSLQEYGDEIQIECAKNL